MSRAKGLVLLSGGLDSSTCLALAISQGYEPYTISFLYGQRHRAETEAAAKVADYFRVPPSNRFLLDLGTPFRGSALTGDMPIPLQRSPQEMASSIPPTYVPARNIVFLAHAAALAEAHNIQDVFIGVNSIDYSGYPDCRPEFISAFTTAVNLGTKTGQEGRPLRIHTPLQRLSKKEIIRLGVALGVPFELTHSCYLGLVPACGECDSCQLRLKGFREAGLRDPLSYASPPPSDPRSDYGGI